MIHAVSIIRSDNGFHVKRTSQCEVCLISDDLHIIQSSDANFRQFSQAGNVFRMVQLYKWLEVGNYDRHLVIGHCKFYHNHASQSGKSNIYGKQSPVVLSGIKLT